IVQEFYVNFPEAQDNKIFVKGVYIDVSPISIEDIHKTSHYTPDFYKKLSDDEVDYDEIIHFLTKGRGHWV
ncbi:hypothetical protein ES319_A10G150200v1, partial [Gossypium barbadense]